MAESGQEAAYSIVADGLTKQFGAQTAVVQLRVREGDLYGFLGVARELPVIEKLAQEEN